MVRAWWPIVIACLGCLWTVVAHADFPCRTGINAAEAMVCADHGLMRLDRFLNNAYRAALDASEDKSNLRLKQSSWLRAVRDRCRDRDCLEAVYSDRILELYRLQVRSKDVAIPLSDSEASSACTSLAALADAGRLPDIDVLPLADWAPHLNEPFPRSMLGEEDTERLRSRAFGLGVTVYSLDILGDGRSTVVGTVRSGGSCRMDRLHSLQILAQDDHSSGHDDAGESDEGVQWPCGYEGRPILYRGRYFVVTADACDPNRIKSVAWIKPDGWIRPICTLNPEFIGRAASRTDRAPVCRAIANGSTKPMAWQTKEIASLLLADLMPPRWPLQGYLNIDINHDGVPEHVGHFAHLSGTGCVGGMRGHLGLITSRPNARSSRALTKSIDSSAPFEFVDVYKHSDKYYVHAGIGDYGSVVQTFHGDKVALVCELSSKFRTTVSKLFPVR